MLQANVPAVILAPMDGLTDAPMRAVQGETGAFSFAVTEFIRVTEGLAGKKMFWREVPELLNDCKTPTGLPVSVQILGGDGPLMGAWAQVACAAGAQAVDINFGCPAPTVNRHDGGATLLKYPQRIREIVRAVRDAVPSHIPVSAKLRLGWDTLDAIHENAAMAIEGGASWLTIHGRTRVAGYAPPAHWAPIGEVNARAGIPVVANGDIWTLDDFRRCRDVTGCDHFMIGRGALANPLLSHQIAHELGLAPTNPEGRMTPDFDWLPYLRRLEAHSRAQDRNDRQILCRVKQWLSIASRYGCFLDFDDLKRMESLDAIFDALEAMRKGKGFLAQIL